MEQILANKLVTARNHYEEDLILKFSSNPKKLFRHLKSISMAKHSPNHLIVNSSPVTDPVKQANLLNDYFHSTFTTSKYKLPNTSNLSAPEHQLSSITIQPEEPYRFLIELNPAKAPGWDNIVLKNCATSLAAPLSIPTGIIPSEWKIHKIRPIPKKGVLTEVTSYTNFSS